MASERRKRGRRTRLFVLTRTKARKASAASHAPKFGVNDSPDGGGEMFELEVESRPVGGGISAARRIRYLLLVRVNQWLAAGV